MTYFAEFYRPESLPDPYPKYVELIKKLHKEIGIEQLTQRIEIISQDWALQSGYYFKPIGDRHLFIHASLNPRDFN